MGATYDFSLKQVNGLYTAAQAAQHAVAKQLARQRAEGLLPISEESIDQRDMHKAGLLVYLLMDTMLIRLKNDNKLTGNVPQYKWRSDLKHHLGLPPSHMHVPEDADMLNDALRQVFADLQLHPLGPEHTQPTPKKK